MAQPSAGRSLSARRPAVLQTGVLSAGFVPSKARASARRAGASPWRRPATLRVRSLRKLRPDGFDPTGIGSPQPPLGRRPATLASTGASQAPSRRIGRTQCGSPQPPPGGGLPLARRLAAASARLRAERNALVRRPPAASTPRLKMPALRTARRSRAVRCASDPSRRCTAPRRGRGRFRLPRVRRRACGRAAPRPPSASARPRGVRR